jgi:ParB-like chromosome segregation protein Spo0J
VRINEGVIVDGHHRYICLTILGMEVETIQGGKNVSLKSDCAWKDLSVQEDDYDREHEKRQFDKNFPNK